MNALFGLQFTKSFKKGFTLGPIDLVFQPGITTVLGANGSGKSTLFSVAAGFMRPTTGSGVHGLLGSRVGYLPQEMVFPQSATCAEYLGHVAWLYQIPKPQRGEKVSSVLGQVGLSDQAGKQISQLSGGMRRRLGIAHAILHDPEILILDEPTAGLDPLQRKQIRAVIGRESTERVTLFSTHLLDDVADLSDHVVVLADGTVTFDGPYDALIDAEPGKPVNHEKLETTLIDHMSSMLKSHAEPR